MNFLNFLDYDFTDTFWLALSVVLMSKKKEYLKGKSTNGSGGQRVDDEVDDERPSLSIDEMLELLKNERRRIVLKYLVNQEEQTVLGDLADHVTAVENDVDVQEITSNQRKRVYVSLYQFHLPKMNDMGVIEYKQKRGTISLTEQGKKLYSQHEERHSPSRDWYRAYFVLAGIGLSAVLLSTFIGSTALAIGLFTVHVVLLVVVATVHAYLG